MRPQSVAKRLRNAGITANDGTWVNRVCTFCNAKIKVRRGVARRSVSSYCNAECYYANLESPGYKQWRQGSRIARAIVSQYYKLEHDNIVHHKDGDTRNNDRANLAVVADQAHHLRVHRRGATDFLWDGAST